MYMSKPLMQLELYHQVITFFNEYTFLNTEVKLVIPDTLIEGASMNTSVTDVVCANECSLSISNVFYCALGQSTGSQTYQGEK